MAGLCCLQLLLPAFPPPGTQAGLTKAGEGVRGVEWPGLRMTQGPAVTKATLLPSNGGFPVTLSPSNGIFSWALAGAWQLFLAQLQINLQLHFWLLEKMQGVCGAAGGRQWTSRQGRKLAMCPKVQAHRWARPESTWEQGGAVQVKENQRLFRLPGRADRCDCLPDGVSGRAIPSSTLGLPRSGWPGAFQASVDGGHPWSVPLGGSFLAPRGSELWEPSSCLQPPAPPRVTAPCPRSAGAHLQEVVVAGVWAPTGSAGLC